MGAGLKIKIDFGPNKLSNITGAVLLLAGLAHLLILVWNPSESALLWAANIFNPSIALVSAGLLLAAAWSHWRAGTGQRRVLAWGILGLAMLCTGAGDLTWMILETFLRLPPTPSVADGFYFLFYLLAFVSASFLPVEPPSRDSWIKYTIDMLIVLMTAFLGLWLLIVGPIFNDNVRAPLIEQVVLTIYPLGDILLLWTILIVMFSVTTHTYPLRRSLWLLVVGMLIFIVGDIGYSFLSLLGLYDTGLWTDAAYSLAYTFIGLAGLQEFRHQDFRPAAGPAEKTEPPMWLQLMPYAWVVGAYIILVATMFNATSLSKPYAAIYVGLITLLVLMRQVISLHENRLLSRSLARLLQQVKQQATDLEHTNREMKIEILERRRMAERLSYDAMHDALTGLPNRALFLDRLAQAARKKARQPGMLYSVMFLDLDGFKLVNDSLGHILGDRLLIRVAGVLRGCVRATDTVARLGGDEFVILVEDVSNSRSVVEMANRVQNELRQPIDLDGTQVYITTSIGIVSNDNEYTRPEDLLRDADLAMYHAKGMGKARYAIFNPAMRAVAVTRLALENDLRNAIERGEFFLEYQPVFNLGSRQPVGFEALLRWQHPERGRLAPGDFLAVAEEAGLLLPIGCWCLNEACKQASLWRARFGALHMGVNISARQFRDPAFVTMVRETLAAHNLPGKCLLLEVPEAICLENIDTLRSVMGDLSALGVDIQIDDFGTGYSSLGYLQRLPVNTVKIDRSFIEPIRPDCDPRAVEIVRGILAMMHSLGIETWAEGIETEHQLRELVQMGCQRGQGYHLARPAAADSIEQRMKNYFPQA